MCYFCHAQLFEITQAENIKPPFGQHSCRNAKVVEALCDAGCRFSTRCWAPVHAGMHVVSKCRRAYHREQRRHAIPIALAASQCPTARDFVPWRFLVAGRFSASSVSSSRRPKTCTRPDSCSAAKLALVTLKRSATMVRFRKTGEFAPFKTWKSDTVVDQGLEPTLISPRIALDDVASIHAPGTT
jgi:hypothetical protein